MVDLQVKMIGLSRSPGMGHVSSETDREDSPPPAPDVTAVSILRVKNKLEEFLLILLSSCTTNTLHRVSC